MAGHSGGPWGGGGGNNGGDGDDGRNGDGRRPPQRPQQGGPQIPELDDLLRQGRERFRTIMGGGGSGDGGPVISRNGIFFGLIALVFLWLFMCFYRVNEEERSVELFLGECIGDCVGQPGLNFALWPLVTYEVLPTTTNQTISVGVPTGPNDRDAGLMLTGDENIVDIEFQVIWNITRLDQYLFNLADPEITIAAVSESAMREIIAQSELAPILNRNRGPIADRLEALIQSTLDSYDAGVNIVRVNFNKADPPDEVIAAFRDVQNAEQERVRLQNEADAYQNQKLAEARGQAVRLRENALGYAAEIVNQAEGEASRFLAVLNEYRRAPEITRRRLYLETMERVLARADVTILDESSGGSGVIPFLSLSDEPRQPTTAPIVSQGAGQ